MFKSIKTEIHTAGACFDILDEKLPMPVGNKKVTYYLVFYIKMDFTREASWAADGHKPLHYKVPHAMALYFV